MYACLNIRKRQKKYKLYFYCIKYKKEIVLSDCNCCNNFEIKRNKGINKVSNKQKQLEKNRYSIFTKNFNKCYYCGKQNIKLDLHEVYGGSNRIRSIKNGLVIPLCRKCHSNEVTINKLRIELQKQYEKIYNRDKFIKLIGKSYIIEEEN